MSYFVYVIQCEEGLRYTGHTSDLIRRLSEHNAGTTHSTMHGTNWNIIYHEELASRGEAMKREKFLKTGAERDFLKTAIRVESAAAE